ncbi:hypothetical protein LTS14_007305 [Recurvomyces mirabilis]|uniref:uncharacterized protein n=1 Tax=Recurvomyces mirabilis TaxID=574656 RepID=UPI002DDEFA0D|nr:hypothetical protein LTS14_007305 [Recurvomyces mirabilis]
MDQIPYDDQLLSFETGDYQQPQQRTASYPISYLDQPIHHASSNHHQHHHNPHPHHHQQHQATWPPMTLEDMSQPHHNNMYMPPTQNQQHVQQPHQHVSRPASSQTQQPMTMQMGDLDPTYFGLLPSDWQMQLQQVAQAQQAQQQQHQQQYTAQASTPLNLNTYAQTSFGAQLQASPVDFMPITSAGNYAVTAGMDPSNFIAMAGPMESMNTLVYPLNDYQNDNAFAMTLNQAALNQHAAESVHSSIPGSSPTGTILEIQSVSDNEWSMVNFNPNRQSIDSFAGTVSNPSQSLHIRTSSDSSSSDDPGSAELSGSYEEIPPWPLHSPHDFHGTEWLDAQYVQHAHGLPVPAQQQYTSPTSSHPVSPITAMASGYRSSGSTSTSPTSSGPLSPPLRRRKSPVDNNGKTTKAVIKKVAHSTRKDATTEKKVGRRRGPLRPEQRQQAHEIRKLRACLRCKFLKKTCDKGEPCGGCRPSHARLWQVPCTRMDIKDIGYFMKDWKADYERHVSLGFSVGNIKGFSSSERTLYITHGYGHYLPINAREVFVRDDKCFGVDWIEAAPGTPKSFELNTAKLSAGMEGVSTSLLSEYLDRHLDNGFESFVDEYFEGTKFITEILKTAYRYNLKANTPSVRKALKLVLAYNLTLHVTMVEGLSEEEQLPGKVEDSESRFAGKTVAPVMINFQVKCALADMWRELQKDILEELSSLYSSVYSGDKLKNWPTIFMLAAILLAIWEEMQFDCHYRVPDEKAVNKFCEDMETTPVGVIVGLFQAISTKLPGLQEWDTRKHHHLLNSDVAVCEALTEVKGHINKHEKYLRERSTAKFDRDDFDSLSNKFLSKLVILLDDSNTNERCEGTCAEHTDNHDHDQHNPTHEYKNEDEVSEHEDEEDDDAKLPPLSDAHIAAAWLKA